jgi:REP element-mobilizing transposase RayT
MMTTVKGRHGGPRTGAGRKKSPMRRHDPSHRRRPELSSHHPVHVVLRTAPDVDRLRRGPVYRKLRGVLQRYLGKDGFRVVHVSIQHNHLHLIVEAGDRKALTRGMQSFAINAARAINSTSGTMGKVFAYRYHATQIRTPRQARRTLAYVLNNWRHHREDQVSERMLAVKLDPYATGLCFQGWTQRFVVPDGYRRLPVSPPRTRLLQSSWARFGRLDPFECPGSLQR